VKTAEPAVTNPIDASDPAKLAPSRGFLAVESSASLGVYTSGTYRGMTGQNIEIDCGLKYVRLGVPPSPSDNGAGIVWKSEGKSTNVVCRSITKLTINPSP
jgi:hypothetical protein